MLPLLAAGLASTAGNLAGGIMDINNVNKGLNSYKNYVGKGTDQLRAGQAAANQAYSPYTGAGAQGVAGLSSAIQNRQQAALPTLQNSNPQNAMSYLDPSAQYSMDQANKATAAQGIAGGAMGGGMMKALSNNANKMAQTNYNNAYNQMLQSNNQNFGQQQQNYQNINDYQQQQIGNYGNMANMGLTANTANQGLQAGYNNGINENYGAIGAVSNNTYDTKGKLFSGLASGLGQSASSLIPQLFNSSTNASKLSGIFGGNTPSFSPTSALALPRSGSYGDQVA